ncbi:MAG: site-specific DNA-methyltransferase [Nanoarchaeota archaeon]|nr:site-specific DNA-methyltransferase [Nanoarchaeota archaeon]
MEQPSLKNKLICYLNNNPQHLNDIYQEFPEEEETTIRGRLNENINKCFKRIGKGIYLATSGQAKALLIEGDAWEKIKDIEDGSIDAIITDSPYSCLNKHLATGTTRKKTGHWSFNTKDIDKELLQEMFRVLKKGGHFFCFLPPDSKDTLDYNNNLIKTSQETGFQFNKRFIWNKAAIGMGYNGRNKYEQIIFLSKEKRDMPYDLSIPDLLTHKRIPPAQRIHETEKPVELIKDLVRFCSKEQDIILDPFAGSFSTARACLSLNRHSISIEIEPDMVQQAVQTLNGIQL